MSLPASLSFGWLIPARVIGPSFWLWRPVFGRSLWLWGIVGSVGAMLVVFGQVALVLYLASSPADLQPTPASIAIWGAGGLVFGASGMAIDIARRLRKEERSG